MEIQPIRSEADYRAALAEIGKLLNTPVGSPEEERLDVISTLVDAYEERHCPMPLPEPIEMLNYYMETRGLSRTDLEPAIGSRARVSEVLNRRRTLTIQMIRRLQSQFGMSADLLIRSYPLVPSTGRAKPKRLLKRKVAATKPGR